MIAGVAAAREKSDSPVAALGYSCTAALGHILLTTWGTIIRRPHDLVPSFGITVTYFAYLRV
jgi:hypothetical protein